MSETREWYAARPKLSSSDPYIENFFRYRWENLEKMTFAFEGVPYLPHPGVYEGLSCFRRHITYSAFAHMLELRWLHNPSIAQGSLLNFIANQRMDGSFPGHIGPSDDPRFVGPHPESFYHANWGRSVLELHLLNPSRPFWEKIYPALARYASYFKRERDRENSYLSTVVNHFETGQEFSPRYLAVDPTCAKAEWENRFQLKGVDATVYVYELYRALSKVALAIGNRGSSIFWDITADHIKKQVRKCMWDPKEEMFFDVDPRTMTRTGVKALTCFYPYFTDIVTKKHLHGLKKHLFNPAEFWTPYPFSTLSIDNPDFSADGIWKGKKEVCPWNGRVWPMTNSHTAEAMAQCAIRFNDQELRERFVEFFNKWMQMMCFGGDPSRPNSFEHYSPFDGSPSTKENGFNNVNDYLHSWINDLIIKYVAGFRPQMDGTFVVDPFPFNIDLQLKNITHMGRKIDIFIANGKARVESQ